MDARDGNTMKGIFSYGLFLLILLAAADAFGWWNDQWEYRHKISFDTSGAGADISENLSDVPVLIRLHTGNFAFKDAKPGGEDIRFVSSDDAAQLPYYIERYDTIDEMAAIWVRIPRLSANSNQDYMWMYYGNEAAAAGDDGAAIFDGLQAAVFHFEELEGQPQDKTVNANHAMSFLGGRGLSGVIGNCVLFSGAADRMVIQPSASTHFTNGFTFSAWVKISQEQDNAYLFSQQSDAGHIRVSIDRSLLFAEIANSEVMVATTERSPVLSSGVWHHVVVTAAPNDRLSVYVNGIETSTVPLSGGIPEMKTEMTIGGDMDGNHGYYGEMDELGISAVARSAGWVRAAFASQGLENRLTSFSEAETGGGTSIMPVFYLGSVVKNITLDGWIIIGVLVIMAIGSWLVFFNKAFFIYLIEKDNRNFLNTYLELDDPTALSDAGERFANSVLFKVYEEGCRKLKECLSKANGCDYQAEPLVNPGKIALNGKLSDRAIHAVKAMLEKGFVEQSKRLNSWMVMLTLAISGGPFLGLLGTVWGVMSTFAALAESGEANLAAIAPGVASALTTTVVGLLVAIPALFSYNFLLSRIKNITMDLTVFIDQFGVRVDEMHGE